MKVITQRYRVRGLPEECADRIRRRFTPKMTPAQKRAANARAWKRILRRARTAIPKFYARENTFLQAIRRKRAEETTARPLRIPLWRRWM